MSLFVRCLIIAAVSWYYMNNAGFRWTFTLWANHITALLSVLLPSRRDELKHISDRRCGSRHTPTCVRAHTHYCEHVPVNLPSFSTALVLGAKTGRLLSQLGSKAFWAEMNDSSVQHLCVFIMSPLPARCPLLISTWLTGRIRHLVHAGVFLALKEAYLIISEMMQGWVWSKLKLLNRDEITELLLFSPTHLQSMWTNAVGIFFLSFSV